MDPEKFSFSKKPISFPKRTSVISVISATMPEPSRESPEAKNYTTATRPSRTFSRHSNEVLDNDVATDDPLLDYDEQIRAPKFLSRKSLDDIGASIDLKNNVSLASSGGSTKAPRKKPLTNWSSSSTGPRPSSSGKSCYQPALAELPSESFEPQPSTSSTENYTLSQITPLNMISNLQHEHDTTTTTSNTNKSEMSSKKSSDDSIVMMSRKAPHFNMAPIRPMSDPRTPNYVPCVLRPIDKSMQSEQDTSLFDSSNLDSDGALTRSHWKPNSSSLECSDCNRHFSLMNRRHHCRKCGDLFCSPCLLSKAKLNFQCKFDVNGILTKVCVPCGKQWSAYLVESFSVDVMPDFKNKRDQLTATASQASHSSVEEQQTLKGLEVNVPADWSWSSF